MAYGKHLLALDPTMSIQWTVQICFLTIQQRNGLEINGLAGDTRTLNAAVIEH